MKVRKELHRDTENGRIAGVCAGIAEFFGLEVWLVRILTLTGFFLLAGPFVLVAYIAAWFILDKKPARSSRHDEVKEHYNSRLHKGKGWHNVVDTEEDKKVEVKARVWQAGEPPRQAFFDIKRKFSRIENRLRKMETYVTSSEYQVSREINKL